MKLIIKAEYVTGDSFGHEDATEILDYDWTDEEVALENVKAILEHYKTYSDNEFGGDVDPSFVDKWWYVKPESKYDGIINGRVRLINGNGDYFIYVCPWCGYFERLDSVEVTFKEYKFYVN